MEEGGRKERKTEMKGSKEMGIKKLNLFICLFIYLVMVQPSFS
jgi:hypothetical protein